MARLALWALSNDAIAQALYPSRKTVEKHCASIHPKPRISSRRELIPEDLVAARPEED